MDPRALLRNIRWSYIHSSTNGSLAKSLYWTYSGSLPSFVKKGSVELHLRYPQPIGELTIRARTNRADRFIFGEVFDHQYYRFGDGMAPTTILDVGANVGYTAIYFARMFPDAQLACLEPELGNAAILEDNLRLNRISATVFRAALSIKDGIEILFINDRDYGHSLVPDDQIVQPRSIEVPTLSVQTILRDLRWSKVDLLKMDIEGYEKQLFSIDASWLEIVDNMLIEWHDTAENSSSALSDIATRYGFAPPQRLPGIWYLTKGAAR